jgi:hypothetical protein
MEPTEKHKKEHEAQQLEAARLADAGRYQLVGYRAKPATKQPDFARRHHQLSFGFHFLGLRNFREQNPNA